MSALLESNKPLRAALKPYGPCLNFRIECTTEPIEFRLSRMLVHHLVKMRAAVDCDLYWLCAPQFNDGACTSCGVRVPTTLDALRPFIGGDRNAAECQFTFSVSGIPRDTAFAAYELDSNYNRCKLDYGLELTYLEPLETLQFSSDFMPCSGSHRKMKPELLATHFVRSLEKFVGEFAAAEHHPQLLVRFVERGDYQGTAGLHFDRRFLADAAALNAGIALRLTYAPDPSFDAFGTCTRCDEPVLSAAAKQDNARSGPT